MSRVLSEGSDWSFELIERYDAAIAAAAAEFGLDTYSNQIEVINSEQMLDAYASGGLRTARSSSATSAPTAAASRASRTRS